VPRVGVHDQIQVPLAVANLDVLQPVPLLGQRNQALGQKRHLRRPDGELVGLGAEQAAGHADEVAEVEQLEHLEVERRDGVGAHVHLDLRAAVRQDQEVGFAKAANGENAPRGDRLDVGRFELVRGLRAVRGDERADRVGAVERARVDVDPECLQRLEVGAPLLLEFLFLWHGLERVDEPTRGSAPTNPG
jgi:hypothetical protein